MTSRRTAESCCLGTPSASASRVSCLAKPVSVIWDGCWVHSPRLVVRWTDADLLRRELGNDRPRRSPTCFAEASMVQRPFALEGLAGGSLRMGTGCCALERQSGLLPTGAGSAVTLERQSRTSRCGLVACRLEADCLYGSARGRETQGLHAGDARGAPRAITPDGVFLPGKAAVRDEDSFLVGPVSMVLYPSRVERPARSCAHCPGHPDSMERGRPIHLSR